MVAQVLTAFLCWHRIRTKYPDVIPKRLPTASGPVTRQWLSRGLWVTGSQFAQALITGTDIVVIARLLGPAAAVPYAFTGKLITVMTNQPQLIMQAAGPGLSEMRVGESEERQLQACNSLAQATMLLSGGVACIIMAVNRAFVSWWTGPEQYAGLALTALFLLNMLLRHWNNPLVYAVFCFGGERRLALTTLFDGLLTLAGAIALVPRIGVIGAPIASLAGVCLISLPGNLVKLAANTRKPVFTLVKPLSGWLWRFVLLMTAAVAVGRFEATGFWMLSLTATLTAAFYGLVMIPVAMQDPLGIYLRPKLIFLRAKLFGVATYNEADA
jgi:O-antigen/teichoic acid export membrane protein